MGESFLVTDDVAENFEENDEEKYQQQKSCRDLKHIPKLPSFVAIHVRENKTSNVKASFCSDSRSRKKNFKKLKLLFVAMQKKKHETFDKVKLASVAFKFREKKYSKTKSGKKKQFPKSEAFSCSEPVRENQGFASRVPLADRGR